MKLLLYIAPKRHFLANAGGYRSCNPNQDFKKTLWQQAIYGSRTTRPKQPVNAIGRTLPEHPEWHCYSQVNRETFPRGPAPARKRFQIASTAMHTDPAVIEQGPVHQNCG